MSPETLLRHFKQISSSPESVPSLRKFVLDLAIREKLVEPDFDSPHGDLLARISAAKSAVVPKTPRDKQDAPIAVDELPTEGVPESRFVRLRELARVEKGNVGIQSATPGEYPLVGLSEARSSCSTFQFDTKAAIIPLISSTGHGHASMKRLHYQEGRFALANILCAVVPYAPELVSARFIYEYFSAYREHLLIAKMMGTANVCLTVEKIRSCPVPLVGPDQQRKMEGLLLLCDELEATQQKRERRRDRLVAASLHALSNGNSTNDGAQSFEESARFYFNHLPRLTTRTEHIKQLRQSVIDLAVKGKLASQNPQDEPARSHFSKIQKQRTSDGVRPEASVVEESEAPYTIPIGWMWVRLGQVIKLWNGFAFKSSDFKNKGVPVVRIGDLQNGTVALDSGVFVDENVAASVNESVWIPDGSLLIAMSGATTGKVAFNRIGKRLLLNQRVGRVQAFGTSIEFVRFFLEANIQRNLRISFGTAIPNLSTQQINATPFPMPPLAEQLRIVAKVGELMDVCDELELRLDEIASTRRSLLETTFREILNSTTGDS